LDLIICLGSRAPSLPPVPKNPKYANVARFVDRLFSYFFVFSRTVNRTEHQKPVSQVKILHKPLKIEAKSKIGSWDNANHVAGGGQNKILNNPVKIEAKSKVGSFSNTGHIAGGGDKKVPTQKLTYNVQSKVGSLANIDHKAGTFL
jgi:hypothetical protein